MLWKRLSDRASTRLWESVLMHMLGTPESSVQSTLKNTTTPHAPHSELTHASILLVRHAENHDHPTCTPRWANARQFTDWPLTLRAWAIPQEFHW